MVLGLLYPLPIVLVVGLNLLYILYMYSNWNTYFKARVCRTNHQSPSYDTNPTFVNGPNLKKKKKKTMLHMDHIHLSFKDFLLITYLVLPNSILLWVSSIFKHVVRGKIISWVTSMESNSLKECCSAFLPR